MIIDNCLDIFIRKNFVSRRIVTWWCLEKTQNWQISSYYIPLECWGFWSNVLNFRGETTASFPNLSKKALNLHLDPHLLFFCLVYSWTKFLWHFPLWLGNWACCSSILSDSPNCKSSGQLVWAKAFFCLQNTGRILRSSDGVHSQCSRIFLGLLDFYRVWILLTWVELNWKRIEKNLNFFWLQNNLLNYCHFAAAIWFFAFG